MLCENCGRSIVDTARFCSYCGAEQRAGASAQGDAVERTARSAMPEGALEASDVTIILPRRRANASVAQPAPRDATPSASTNFVTNDGSPSAPHPAQDAYEPGAMRRSGAMPMKIGAVALVAIIAVVVGVAFHTYRPATPAGKTLATPISAAAPTPGPTPIQRSESDAPAPPPTSTQRDESEGRAANVQAPDIAPTEAGTAQPSIADKAESEATPPVDVAKPAPASKSNATQRTKARAPITPPTAPSPVDNPVPRAAEVAAPVPEPVAPAPAIEPAKVEKVACADSANPFSREVCLWQECAKPEFQSHAECARFTGPGGRR